MPSIDDLEIERSKDQARVRSSFDVPPRHERRLRVASAEHESSVRSWFAAIRPTDRLSERARRRARSGTESSGFVLVTPLKRRGSTSGSERFEESFGDRILAVDHADREAWGRIPARREPLPVLDRLIAATALVHGLDVVTRDTAPFERIGVPRLDPVVGVTRRRPYGAPYGQLGISEGYARRGGRARLADAGRREPGSSVPSTARLPRRSSPGPRSQAEATSSCRLPPAPGRRSPHSCSGSTG